MWMYKDIYLDRTKRLLPCKEERAGILRLRQVFWKTHQWLFETVIKISKAASEV